MRVFILENLDSVSQENRDYFNMLNVRGENMFYKVLDRSGKTHKYAYKDISFLGFDENLCPHCGRTIAMMHYHGGGHKLVLEGGKEYPDLLGFHGAGKQMLIFSGKALSLFKQYNISGISDSEQIQVLEKRGSELIDLTGIAPDYWAVHIVGTVELDFSSMRLKKKNGCEHCGQFTWNRQRLTPLALDENTWNGHDLCRVTSIPGYVVCTSAVKRLVEEYALSGFDFTLL